MKTIGVMCMLLVQDMDRAIGFYAGAFDFKVTSKSGFWSNVDCGHGCLGLTSFGNKSELKETPLIIEVDDYLAAIERVKQHGGKVLKINEPYEGAPVYNVQIIDTENNQIVISQMVK